MRAQQRAPPSKTMTVRRPSVRHR